MQDLEINQFEIQKLELLIYRYLGNVFDVDFFRKQKRMFLQEREFIEILLCGLFINLE